MKLEKIKLWSEKLGKFALVQDQPQIRLFAEVLADFYLNAYRSTYSQREILDFLLDSPPHWRLQDKSRFKTNYFLLV